jgi:hypothetical protein
VGAPDERDDPGVMQLQTYRDVVREFRTHPEAKSADATGLACGRQTIGLLRRREVQETVVAHVGKEANKLEEVEAGLEHDPETIYTEYRHPERDPWNKLIVPILRQRNLAAIARKTGVSERQLRTLALGRVRPQASTLRRIVSALTQNPMVH